jgi:broad specificity phosphatase PhoE
MYESKTNPGKRFGSAFVGKRYDSEHEKDKQRIFCIRHGQTALDDLHRSDGWLDLPLNDEGRQNIVLQLKFLKKIPITKIYTAPLRRTEETAKILQSGIMSHPSIEVSEEIKTWNLGSLAGDPKKPNKVIVKDLLRNPSKEAPDGESYDEFTGRFDPYLENLEKQAKEKGPFLVVLSGSNCRRVSELSMGDREDLDMDESGLFVLQPDTEGKWKAKVIDKKRDLKDIENNPEAS